MGSPDQASLNPNPYWCSAAKPGSRPVTRMCTGRHTHITTWAPPMSKKVCPTAPPLHIPSPCPHSFQIHSNPPVSLSLSAANASWAACGGAAGEWPRCWRRGGATRRIRKLARAAHVAPQACRPATVLRFRASGARRPTSPPPTPTRSSAGPPPTPAHVSQQAPSQIPSAGGRRLSPLKSGRQAGSEERLAGWGASRSPSDPAGGLMAASGGLVGERPFYGRPWPNGRPGPPTRGNSKLYGQWIVGLTQADLSRFVNEFSIPVH
jgi:hypothetical protein